MFEMAIELCFFVRCLKVYNNIFKVHTPITQLAHKSPNLTSNLLLFLNLSLLIYVGKTKQLFVDITAVFALTVDIRRWYVVGVGRTDQYMCV